MGTYDIAHDVEVIGRISAVPTILQVVAKTTGMRFAAVARVTETNWTACAVYDNVNFGLKPGGELLLESTICNEIRQSHRPVIFGHASASEVFCNHATPKQYGFESYVSVPILRANGDFFGTLCALDPNPAKLDDPAILQTFELFAQLIAAQLDVEERLEASATALGDAHETAKLREQFIAVLGHDLRQPLQAIRMGMQVLERTMADAPALRTVRTIQRSIGRMSEMIQNVLDFARGRLGGGIPVARLPDGQLADELRHVVAEVQSAHPERRIDAALQIGGAVDCDRGRIAQLFANLLGNAVAHGSPDHPIQIAARTADGQFELAVSNGGAAIPEDKLPQLFQPFTRTDDTALKPGLGLGLYIAAEIAKAHDGTLTAASSGDETRFVFRMPLGAA